MKNALTGGNFKTKTSAPGGTDVFMLCSFNPFDKEIRV